MTTETRYFTSTNITYKGITCKKLLTSNSASNTTAGILNGSRIGIRVWKSDASDTETEITAGTPVATAIYIDDGEYEVDWTPTATALATTDKIVVRVYMTKSFPVSWSLLQTFVSEALGAQSLDAVAWTVHYELIMPLTTLNFAYGNVDPYDSRIANFTWTPISLAAFQGDGLTGWS